ncbi:MAG: hypothetical protein ACOWWM_20370 [Desulfobacterales bacterium]
MELIGEKLKRAQQKKRQRIESGKDPVVAGWQCVLEELLIQLEPYLRPGELVTFKVLAPEEKELFSALRALARIPEGVCAVFLPPTVIRGMMRTQAGTRIMGWPVYYRERHPDSGVLVASRCRDYNRIVNALLAHPPFTPGIDVYEDGHLLAGYSYGSIEEFQNELSRVLRTYLKSPVASDEDDDEWV